MTLILVTFVLGRPDFVTVTNEKAGVGLVIPNNAVEVADGVFSLGHALDVDGRVVEGFAIVHYKENFAKPPWAGGGKKTDSTCYGFLAKGAKWKTVEPYIVNPANTRGLDESFVVNNLALDINKWEKAAGVEIVGEGFATSEPLVADTSSPDNRNEVYFGSISDSRAIAVTIVWGIFSGPPKWRELVEWDMIYNQVDFDWSASGEPNKMDFENIATHELGHTVGLSDLYTTECSEETMYGYGVYGETKKRDLNAGDIAGINNLY